MIPARHRSAGGVGEPILTGGDVDCHAANHADFSFDAGPPADSPKPPPVPAPGAAPETRQRSGPGENGDVEPVDEPPGGDLGPLGSAPDEGVTLIVRNPEPIQKSQNSLIYLICSSISSATTSFLFRSLSRSPEVVLRCWVSIAAFLRHDGGGAILEDLPLPRRATACARAESA